MTFGSLHFVDIAVVAAYLAAVLYIGQRAASNTGSEEGFFLAGRKLGKAYQFSLTFGNATEPQGAVSTASLVFQRGVTGNYLKRFMIILWAFAGLVAIALFGVGGLADPDVVWGAMSNRLLGPGLIGLMLAGVLAGTMSTLAAMAETRRQPGRFDDTKLFPRSSWEFCRWDRVDTVGFIACCALSAAIVGLFVLLVRLAP